LKINSKLTYKVSFELSHGYFFDKAALKNGTSYFLEYKFINQDILESFYRVSNKDVQA